jgi:hypothetical protein
MTADRKRKQRVRAAGGKYTTELRAAEATPLEHDAAPGSNTYRAAEQALSELLSVRSPADRRLALDLDGQANAQTPLGHQTADLTRTQRGGEGKTTAAAFIRTDANGLTIDTGGLIRFDPVVTVEVDNTAHLAEVLKTLDVDEYWPVIVDCPPPATGALPLMSEDLKPEPSAGT